MWMPEIPWRLPQRLPQQHLQKLPNPRPTNPSLQKSKWVKTWPMLLCSLQPLGRQRRLQLQNRWSQKLRTLRQQQPMLLQVPKLWGPRLLLLMQWTRRPITRRRPILQSSFPRDRCSRPEQALRKCQRKEKPKQKPHPRMAQLRHERHLRPLPRLPFVRKPFLQPLPPKSRPRRAARPIEMSQKMLRSVVETKWCRRRFLRLRSPEPLRTLLQQERPRGRRRCLASSLLSRPPSLPPTPPRRSGRCSGAQARRLLGQARLSPPPPPRP